MNNGTQIYDPAANNKQRTLRRQFYQKLHTEYLAYELEVCRKEPTDIFNQAKEIVPVMLMYEHLLAITPSLSDEWLKVLYEQESLIKTCCGFWKNNRNWSAEEAADFCISELCRKEAA